MCNEQLRPESAYSSGQTLESGRQSPVAYRLNPYSLPHWASAIYFSLDFHNLCSWTSIICPPLRSVSLDLSILCLVGSLQFITRRTSAIRVSLDLCNLYHMTCMPLPIAFILSQHTDNGTRGLRALINVASDLIYCTNTPLSSDWQCQNQFSDLI